MVVGGAGIVLGHGNGFDSGSNSIDITQLSGIESVAFVIILVLFLIAYFTIMKMVIE
jgi:hypothetical protein